LTSGFHFGKKKEEKMCKKNHNSGMLYFNKCFVHPNKTLIKEEVQMCAKYSSWSSRPNKPRTTDLGIQISVRRKARKEKKRIIKEFF